MYNNAVIIRFVEGLLSPVHPLAHFEGQNPLVAMHPHLMIQLDLYVVPKSNRTSASLYPLANFKEQNTVGFRISSLWLRHCLISERSRRNYVGRTLEHRK